MITTSQPRPEIKERESCMRTMGEFVFIVALTTGLPLAFSAESASTKPGLVWGAADE